MNVHVEKPAIDDRPTVARSLEQLKQLKRTWTGVSAETAARLNDAEEQILEELFSKPCADASDLLAKAEAWRMVIDEGGDQAQAWGENRPIFVADIERLAGRHMSESASRLPGWRLLAADGGSVSEADELGRAILAAPARSLVDLAAKHEVLLHAIGEELPPAYRVLLARMGDELRQMV